MVGNLIKYICGYTEYNVFCPTSAPFYLIKMLGNCADLLSIGTVNGQYVGFTCKRKYDAQVLECIEKCGCEIISKQQKGIFLLFSKAYSRIGMVIGAIICCALIYMSSLFIWEIRLVGNENLDDAEMLNTLNYLGFYEGCLKSKINLDKLHNDFLLCEKRVSWIAVNIKGNIAYVETSMRDFPPDKIDKSARNNIVAAHDGIIVRVDAYEGGKLVKEGEVVSKGQLLISAFFDTKDNNVFFTNSRGSVIAKTVRNFEVKVNKNKTSIDFTGTKKEKKSLIILGKEIPFGLFVQSDYDNYIKQVSKENIVVLGVKLPIKLKKTIYHEVKYTEQTQTYKQARKQAVSSMLEKISKEMPCGEIVSITINEQEKDGYVYLTYTCHCIEDIAKQQPVYYNDGTKSSEELE